MAIKYPDILKSNNPKTFGIVEAKEIAGHRRVSTKEELYSLAAPILSEEYRIVEETDSEGNKTSVEYGTEAAIGQVWFVSDEGKHYKLVNWGNRDNESGWEVFGESSSSNTADKLTTARKIGITGGAVGTGTNFDGSASINIPVTTLYDTPLAYKTLSDRNTEAKGLTLMDAVTGQFTANRLAFKRPDHILIEYSNDGGVNWNISSHTDETKVNLVSGIGTNLYLGNKTTGQTIQDKLRITIFAAKDGLDFYSTWQRLYVYLGTNGAEGLHCTYEYSLRDTPDNWVSQGDWRMVGWSGWNKLSYAGGTSFGGRNSSAHPFAIRLTFWFVRHADGYENKTNACIYKLELRGTTVYGNYTGCKLAETGHMYDYDWQKNVTFPANVTATKHITQGGSADQVVLGDGTLKELSEIGGGSSEIPIATDSLIGGIKSGKDISVDSASGEVSVVGMDVSDSTTNYATNIKISSTVEEDENGGLLSSPCISMVKSLTGEEIGAAGGNVFDLKSDLSPDFFSTSGNILVNSGYGAVSTLNYGVSIDSRMSLEAGSPSPEISARYHQKIEATGIEQVLAENSSAIYSSYNDGGVKINLKTQAVGQDEVHAVDLFLGYNSLDGVSGEEVGNLSIIDSTNNSSFDVTVGNDTNTLLKLSKDDNFVEITPTQITASKFINPNSTSDTQVLMADGSVKEISEIIPAATDDALGAIKSGGDITVNKDGIVNVTGISLSTPININLKGAFGDLSEGIDGSGDVSFYLTNLGESYLKLKTGVYSYGGTLFDYTSGTEGWNNRFSFWDPDYIKIEYYSVDREEWLNYWEDDSSIEAKTEKLKLVTTNLQANIRISDPTVETFTGSPLRVTLDFNNGRSFNLSKLLIDMDTTGQVPNARNSYIVVEYVLESDYSEGNVDLWQTAAYYGWEKINSGIATYSLPDYNYYFGKPEGTYSYLKGIKRLRLQLHQENGEDVTMPMLRSIHGLGITSKLSNNIITDVNLPRTGHIYSFDAFQNVDFPANVTAPKFITKDGTADQVVLGDGSLRALSEIGGKTYSVATPDSDGLMSKEDKIKSDLFEYSIEENSLDCNAKINPIGVEVNNSSETLESKLQLTKSEFTGTEDLCLDITSTNTIPELPAPIVGRIAVSPGAIGSARYFSFDDGEYKEEVTSGLFIDNSLSLDEGGVYSKITNKVGYESTIENHTTCVDINSDQYSSSLSIFTELKNHNTGEYSKKEFLVNTAYDGAGIRLWNHKENTSSGIQFSVDNFLVPEIQLVKEGVTEVLINSTGITAPKFITKDGTADQVVLGDGSLKPLSEIGGSGSSTGGLELGTTETTAFRGDLGQAVYDAIFTINKPVCPNIIKVSDLVIKNYNGEVLENESLSVSNNETSGASITIENGIKLDFSLEYKWVSSDDYKNPKAIDLTAEDGITLPWTTLVNTSNTYSNKVSYSNVSSGKTYKAKTSAPKVGLMVEGSTVKPASGNDFGSGEFKVNITRRRFFGLISNGSEITSSLITGLESELSTGRAKSVTITVPGDKQYVYAFESSLGTPAITNKDGESQADFWPVKKITVTNSYGKAIEYSCYVCGAGSYTNSLVNFK